MKTLNFLPLIAALAVLSFFVSGCTKEQENSPANPLVGTWVTDKENPETSSTYVFNSDATGSVSDKTGSRNFEYTYSQTTETLIMVFIANNYSNVYGVQKTAKTLMLNRKAGSGTGSEFIKLTQI